MKTHFTQSITLHLIWLIVFTQMIPNESIAQYNIQKKKTAYVLPQTALAVGTIVETQNPQIHEGKDAIEYFTQQPARDTKNSTSSMFRRNPKPSTSSIERAITYQRSVKPKIDLSFLANIGYSLLGRGHLYLQRNDVNTPTIMK
jgi:hypothetical protein